MIPVPLYFKLIANLRPPLVLTYEDLLKRLEIDSATFEGKAVLPRNTVLKNCFER